MTAPLKHPLDTTNSQEFYIVIFEAGGGIPGKRKRYSVELDLAQHNRRSIVSDIATGQIANVKQVLCARIGEPLEDVTHDICADIWLGRGFEWSIEGDVLDLLQEHLGVTQAWAVA
jgi:hypothetical protein